METSAVKSLKVVLVGEERSGKTALLTRLLSDHFTSFYERAVSPEPPIVTLGSIRLRLWDTYGRQGLRKITCTFFRGMHIGVLCFDCRSTSQFEGLSSYLSDINTHWVSPEANSTQSGPKLLLVSTFSDCECERRISVVEAEQFAVEHDLHYLDFSSKSESQTAVKLKLFEVVEKYLTSS